MAFRNHCGHTAADIEQHLVFNAIVGKGVGKP